jgi:Glycosyltransferase family 87
MEGPPGRAIISRCDSDRVATAAGVFAGRRPGRRDAAMPADRQVREGFFVSRRNILRLGIVCALIGLLAWSFYLLAFQRDPGQDWMVFYTAAQSYFGGHLPVVFDGRTLTAALNRRFAGWLGLTLNMHPWVYPPTFLLLFLPFGLLPPAASLAAFLLSGLVAAVAAAWRCVGRGPARAVMAFTLVLCPAVPFNVMTGQNAFFTSALLVGGFGLLGRFPGSAGVFFGILTFKPQLWLMVPVALLAARQWRALASTALTAGILALLSLLLFGPDIWHRWIDVMIGADPTYRAWVINGRLKGMSVFACASVLGASPLLANLLQALAAAVAAAVVYWSFRRPAAPMLQLSAMLGATMLAAPHASASDAVMLGLAAGFYLVAPRREAPGWSTVVIAAALWIAPLVNPPSVFWPGSITPVLILVFLAMLVDEVRQPGARGTASAG